MLRYATKRYNLWRRTCNCMISRTHKGVAKIAVFFIHEPNTVLSVPYSCCATLWNGTSYKHGLHRGHHQKRLEQRMFLLLSDNLTVDFGFLALQDKYNIRTLSININLHSLRNMSETYLLLKLIKINCISPVMYVLHTCIYVFADYMHR